MSNLITLIQEHYYSFEGKNKYNDKIKSEEKRLKKNRHINGGKGKKDGLGSGVLPGTGIVAYGSGEFVVPNYDNTSKVFKKSKGV